MNETELVEHIGKLMTRLNDIDSQLLDIKGWRDPKNTASILETQSNNIEALTKALGDLTRRVVYLESPKIGQADVVIPAEPKKKRGRPAMVK